MNRRSGEPENGGATTPLKPTEGLNGAPRGWSIVSRGRRGAGAPIEGQCSESTQDSVSGQVEQVSAEGRRPRARERSRSASSSGQAVTDCRREERPVKVE